MKVNVTKKFWDKSNIFAKICLMIGLFFVDLSMKLNGLEEKN